MPTPAPIKKKSAQIPAYRGTEFGLYAPEAIDYALPSPGQAWGTHANLIPVESAVHATRNFYGARFVNQALPLVNAEAPLVQNLDETDEHGRSFDQVMGEHVGALRSKIDGVVKEVTPDRVVLHSPEGKKVIHLHKHLPLNRKTAVSQVPIVSPGQPVKAGDLLARSNFTDANGTLAMGVNARIGLVPYRGLSMDDSIVVSQAFANKLTSDHTQVHELEYSRGQQGGQGHFISLFPNKFTKNQLANMDQDGVVKVGQTVAPGDPLILASRPRVVSSRESLQGRLGRQLQASKQDASIIWDQETPGKVLDVHRTRKGVKVVVNTQMPTKEGDKIVNRSGNKSIISHIIPDENMPRTADGQPLDVLLNPLGIPSRINDSLVYELLLGKAAHKQGAPLVLPSFPRQGGKWHEIVAKALADAGETDKEEVWDPESNRKLENPITVGYGYVMKLHHTASCYDEETEVLTRRGWVKWCDVTEVDYLASVEGNQLIYEQPIKLIKEQYDGVLLGFKGRYVDYLVTPNHRLWVRRYHRGDDFYFETAYKLHGTRFCVRQGGFIPDKDRFYSSITIGHTVLTWDDYAELLGWWVSEGCVGSNKVSALIYQSSSANPEKCAAIERLIKRIGFKWSYYKVYGKKMGFVINDRYLANHLKQFGTHSDLKRLPRSILEGPLSGRILAYEALMSGDGNRGITPTGKAYRYGTTSLGLSSDFQELCVRSGKAATVHYNVQPNHPPEHKDIHYCAVNLARPDAQVDGDRNAQQFYKTNYKGVVYCAEMRTGLLYVRRNGKAFLCGNSKVSARGQGMYDLNAQPLKGGEEEAGAKRLSGLESSALMSSGAWNFLREGATVRGTRNDAYWRDVRSGYEPKEPGAPFVWDKFKALLQGAGLKARANGSKLRLGPLTDRDVDAMKPVEIRNSRMIDLNTMDTIKGGLFDPALVGSNSWGMISLPHAFPNPAFESPVRKLLGLTENQYRDILAGKQELPEHLKKRVLEHRQKSQLK